MSKLSWREQLTEMGGYDNAFIGIHAGAVREIIQELEDCRTENTRLQQRLMQLEQFQRETNRAAEVREQKGQKG